MKLQLNEETLNAYINEAIRQELDEGIGTVLGKIGKGLANLAKGAGKVAGKSLKNAGKGAQRYTKALFGNRKSVQALEGELKSLRGQLDDVVKQQKSLWGKEGSGMAGHELVKQERGLRAAIERAEKALAQAKAGAKLARTSTAVGAGAYLLGRKRGESVANDSSMSSEDPDSQPINPDAPWNTPENGGDNGGGFDGSFPWDSTNPVYTPRPPRKKKEAATPDPVVATPSPTTPEETGSTTPRISGRIEAPTTSIAATLPKQQDTIQGGIRPLDQTLTQRALSTMAKAGTDAVENGNKRVKGLGGIERGARRAGGDKDTLRKARKSVQQGVKDAANQNL